MVNSNASIKKDARLAGLLYLFHTIAIIYGVFYVSAKIGISGTPALAERLLSDDTLFRSGIISRLLGTASSLWLACVLYRLLEPVNRSQARLVLAWVLVATPFQFIAEAFNTTSMMVANGELLKTLDLAQRQDFVALFQNCYNNLNSISQCFWGLWLFPFGLLVYKSGFIPKVFGVVLCLGATGFLVDYIAFLCCPALRSLTALGLVAGFLSEMAMMAWLLYCGMRGRG